ncbi:MAG: SusF/SusE family outer membrane protein, partial [Bacteroidota bacterium]
TGFPFGTGIQDGPNIPVSQDGNYTISFNDSTGAYYFAITSPIGIIGSAAPFGWDMDVNMFPDTADMNLFHITLDLVMGEAKFRQDDDWAVNWGNTGFPSDTGVQDGPNIPVPSAGNYTVSLDTSTGVYSFVENITFANVGIIGDGTPNGWDSTTLMTQSGSDPNVWTLSTSLPGGGLQFAANDGAIVWGAEGFPTDTATLMGDTLQVPAGDWQIEFNTETGIYDFTLIVVYDSMGIIGDATPGLWDTDTDMERDPNDSSQWSLRIVLTDGEAKFRADNDWADNWGAGDFPSGVGIKDGANIPITAGEYIISFNSISGEYNFQEIVVYDSMGLIGPATPLGNWDDDVMMTQDANDENLWILNSIDLVDGEAKFRAEGEWTVNWGAEDFPMGTGTQDGPNIMITAGTYGVTLNSGTGEYAFGDEITSIDDILNPSVIKVFPNPSNGLMQLDLSNSPLFGKLNLKVFDMQGKLLKTFEKQSTDILQLDVTDLPNGVYSLQVTNEKYLIGKRLIISK